MAIVALAAVKARPWVTTTAVAVAATWPRPVVMAEFDPSGGDIAARFGLRADVGLVSLTAGLSAEPGCQLLEHCQELPGGLQVLTAPVSSAEMRVPLDALAGELASLAVAAGVDVIVDCGRLESASMTGVGGGGEETGGRVPRRTATMRLLENAGTLVLLVRPVRAELHHLPAWLKVLRRLEVPLSLVLAGRGDYGAEEVEASLGVRVVASIPEDAAGARCAEGVEGFRRPDRLPLFRAAREVATLVASELQPARGFRTATTAVEATP